jgi:hypothetical protein
MYVSDVGDLRTLRNSIASMLNNDDSTLRVGPRFAGLWASILRGQKNRRLGHDLAAEPHVDPDHDLIVESEDEPEPSPPSSQHPSPSPPASPKGPAPRPRPAYRSAQAQAHEAEDASVRSLSPPHMSRKVLLAQPKVMYPTHCSYSIRVTSEKESHQYARYFALRSSCSLT